GHVSDIQILITRYVSGERAARGYIQAVTCGAACIVPVCRKATKTYISCALCCRNRKRRAGGWCRGRCSRCCCSRCGRGTWAPAERRHVSARSILRWRSVAEILCIGSGGSLHPGSVGGGDRGACSIGDVKALV